MIARLLRYGMWIGIGLALTLLVIVTTPRLAGGHSYSVLSDSMRGAVDVGDQVMVLPLAAGDIEVGQIVAFEDESRQGMLLQHRVIDVERAERAVTVTTRGDANTGSETWQVPTGGAVGEVVVAIPKLGYVLGQAGAPPVRIALIVLGLLCVATLCLSAIWSGRGRRIAASALVGWLLVMGIGAASGAGIGGALSSSVANSGNEFSAADDFSGG